MRETHKSGAAIVIMAVRQPVRDQESDTRRVTFTVEVSADGPHPPNDLTYIDRARRAVRHGRETEVSVTPLRE